MCECCLLDPSSRTLREIASLKPDPQAWSDDVELLATIVIQADYERSWPETITSDQVGAALYRLAFNSREEDPLGGIIRGWHAQERRFLLDLSAMLQEVQDERDQLLR